MTQPRADTIDILRTLIGFDTTSRNSNLELIHWAQAYLSERGVQSELQFDGSGEKANLWATIGPADTPGIMLSGHSDVVPVDGQNWATEPFEMVQERRSAVRAWRGGHEGLHRHLPVTRG